MTSDTHSPHKSGGPAEPERPSKSHATRPGPAPSDESEEPVELLIRVPLHDEPEAEAPAAVEQSAGPADGLGAAPAAELDAIERIRSGPPPEPDAASRARFARLLLRSGSLIQARSQYEALAATDDLDSAGLLDLAEVRWRTGDLMGAGSAAAAYVSGGGDQVLGFLIAAEAAAGIGRQVEARRNAEIVEKQAPDLDALFAGVPRRMNWSHSTILPPVAIQIEVPPKPEAAAPAAEQAPAPLPPAETLWQQIEEVAVAAEKAATEKAAAEKAQAEKAQAEKAQAEKAEAEKAAGEAQAEAAAEPATAEAQVAEPPAEQAPAGEVEPATPEQPVEPATPEQPVEQAHAEQQAEAAAVEEPVEPSPDQALKVEEAPQAEAPEAAQATEAQAPPEAPVEAAPEPQAEPAAEAAVSPAPEPSAAPAPAEEPAPEPEPEPAAAQAPEPAASAPEPEPAAAPAPAAEPTANPWDDEVAAGSAALEAADPLLAALHYAVALRMSPHAARAVLDGIGERRDLALELVRVDALRLAGNESDAGEVEASVASKLMPPAPPEAPAPKPAQPAPPEPPKKRGPEPPPIRWE